MSTRFFKLLLAATAVATFFSSGCATKIAIRSLEPGVVSVGATKHLTILHGEGRRSAREFVFEEFVSQCRSNGYFSAVDRSEDGIVVRVAGRRVSIDGAEHPIENDEAGLRVDILEWNSSRDMEVVETRDKDGNVHKSHVPVKRGNALLAVTIFDASGRSFVAEKEYEGVFSTRDMRMDRAEVIENAARFAVSRVLGEITPRQLVSWVVLDADDPGQEPIIETAKAGNVAQAAEDARRYLDSNPNSAGAAYNLGVFLEATGDFAGAMESYDRALRLGNKNFYSSARANCARRLAAAEELAGQPDEPPSRGEHRGRDRDEPGGEDWRSSEVAD